MCAHSPVTKDRGWCVLEKIHSNCHTIGTYCKHACVYILILLTQCAQCVFCMYAPNINGSFTAKPSHALPYYPIPAICNELHMYSMLHTYHWTEPSDLCIQRGGGGVCVKGQRRPTFHMGDISICTSIYGNKQCHFFIMGQQDPIPQVYL